MARLSSIGSGSVSTTEQTSEVATAIPERQTVANRDVSGEPSPDEKNEGGQG